MKTAWIAFFAGAPIWGSLAIIAVGLFRAAGEADDRSARHVAEYQPVDDGAPITLPEGGTGCSAAEEEYRRDRLHELDELIYGSGKRSGKSFSSFLAFQNATHEGKRALYRGPGYVVMPDAIYEELVDSRKRQDQQKGVAGYMLGMDPGRPGGSVDVWRQP